MHIDTYIRRPLIATAAAFDGTEACAEKIREWLGFSNVVVTTLDACVTLYLVADLTVLPVIKGEVIVREGPNGTVRVFAADDFASFYELHYPGLPRGADRSA